jgi:hypothetical protein
MDLLGTIEPSAGATSGQNERITLIGTHPSLAPVPPRQGINPFTKGPCLYKARPDTARVLIEGREVGSIEWAQDESQLLVVWSDAATNAQVAKVAADVASQLGWRYVPA